MNVHDLKFLLLDFENLTSADLYSISAFADIASERQAKKFMVRTGVKNPLAAFKTFGTFCMYKVWAINAKNEGKLKHAERLETIANNVYNRLPLHLREMKRRMSAV